MSKSAVYYEESKIRNDGNRKAKNRRAEESQCSWSPSSHATQTPTMAKKQTPPVSFQTMAAANMPTTTNTGDNMSSSLTQQLLHKPAFKKLAVIILSFLPAFLALSIINVIFTHVFVLSSYLFGASTNNAAGSSSTGNVILDGDKNGVAMRKRAKQKRVKTVYVEPTQNDLENILVELASSEPLINNNTNGESPTKRVQSMIASLQALMEQRAKGVDTALKEMEELTEAYESFVQRFEEDIAHHTNEEREDDDAKTVVLEHLPQFLKRKSLLDLDRHSMEVLFDNVITDVNLLVQDETILRNSNQALMKLLNGSNNNKSGSNNGASSSSSCDSAFLDLAKGNPTPELETVADPTKESTPDKTATTANNDAIITKDTARESDLYERIASIKEILSSRRELSGNNKNPIDEEFVAEIRSEVNTMALILQKKREAAFAHEKELKQHLMEEMSLSTSIESIQEEDDTDDAICASPTMVEKMVHRGLDSIRSQADLQSTLITTVFNVVADESEDGEFQQIMDKLDKDMNEIDVPRIDYSKKRSGEEEGESKNRPPKSDKKKTLSYVVDGPLLHRGIAGLIDSFVELISGYNDHVDEVIDYIMSRQGVSVGTATSDAISNLIRKVPLPELDRLRQSGILGGRIRSLVEESK
jgi:hypothetical protein